MFTFIRSILVFFKPSSASMKIGNYANKYLGIFVFLYASMPVGNYSITQF